ncbi:cupin domain-containing protein [Streptomyces shenzhenensis]|uniref:cupin domain-containing protein n=1 Tax=Streptomyces shenzhenensis TaxID=943815 RepID=UPI0033F3F541
MTITNTPSTATGLEVKPLGPPSAEPLSGEILVRSRVDFTNEERTVVSGIWESDPGSSRWEFLTRGEIIHVISGHMTVQRDGEDPVEVTAGTTAYFPIGWCGTWTVHETLRKVYVVFKS